MLRNLLCLFGLFASIASFAQAPGNVTANLRWWLKANEGVYTNNGFTAASDGQLVQQWSDQSLAFNHARQTNNTHKPVYRTNQINGYPSLHFAGDNFITALAAAGIAGNESFNFFIVLKQHSYLNTGTITDGYGTFIVDRATEVEQLMSLKIVDSNKFGYQKRNNAGGNLEGPQSATPAPIGTFSIVTFFRNYNSNYGIYIDGRLDVTTTNNVNDQINGPVIQLGRHAVNANQGLDGEIAEVIVYDDALTSAERKRIESYLAIKYGITLDQTTLTNYTRSNGNVIYPVASNASFAPYRYNIAGIGRDNNSDLIQSSSHSQNTSAVLQISNPSSLANNDWLVWGSNDGSMSSPNATDVDGNLVERRLARVWRIAETNNIGTVRVTVDLSSVPGPKVQSDLRLLIDRDGDGFSDNDIAPITGTLSGSLFTVSGVNLNNGDYITVGTINASDTPLPVELLSFDLSREDNFIISKWRTATETNNDFFTVERSHDGVTWEAIDTVKGSGNSLIERTYTSIDTDPYNGRSYYRIRQTDFDEKFTYSPVRSISIELPQRTLSFFPNPNLGKTFYMKSTIPINTESSVQIYDASAKRKYSIKPKQSRRGPDTYLLEVPEKLPPGMYFMSLKSAESVETRKVIVR